MPKIFDDREAVKQRILEAARNLFAREGLVGTRAQDIARASGIAKGTLYRFFPSKESLFYQIFLQEQENLFEGLMKGIFPSILASEEIEIGEKLKIMVLKFLEAQEASPILGRIHHPRDREKFNHFLSAEHKARFLSEDVQRMNRLINLLQRFDIKILVPTEILASLMRKLYLLYLDETRGDSGWDFLLQIIINELRKGSEATPSQELPV